MADISTIFGILLTLGIAFPGLLTAFWLLFPSAVERARARLEYTPWKTFWAGAVVLIAVTIPIVILIAIPLAPAKVLGVSLLALALSIACIGAAGLAARVAEQLRAGSSSLSSGAAFVRGALALELAAFFPMLGWFVVLPVAFIVSLGATFFALFRWSPRQSVQQPLPDAVH